MSQSKNPYDSLEELTVHLLQIVTDSVDGFDNKEMGLYPEDVAVMKKAALDFGVHVD